MTRIDVGEGSGWLRLRLRPATDTTVARVTIESHGTAGGPVVNNARDLHLLARDFTAACERLAGELHPGPPDREVTA